MSSVRSSPRLPFFSLLAATWSFALLLGAPPVNAGGTPDPGNTALSTTNRNGLMEVLGPDRGFGFGDYVTDRVSGLQRGGAVETYDFYIEVPPGQGQLVVQIFDADAGAGDNLGTPAVNEDLHDQDNTTAGWGMSTTYQLFDPSGASVAVRNLAGQDCDPTTGGLQGFCDNAWSDLGAFTITNPIPGHWRMAVGSPNTGLNDEDDANSYGLRAHDGNATGAGNEFPVYANTFVGVGQVYAANAGADPGLSRVADFFPFIRRDCTCDSNDFDSDSSAPIDESTVFTTRTGATPTGSNGPLSGATVWRQNILSNWTTAQSATDYGIWRLRWTSGRFNHLTYSMGDETNSDPSNAAPGPGNGVEPNSNPENGAIRLYLPADGSRMFGLAGGANDVIAGPAKPWVGHSWALLPGQPPIEANVTSIVRVTITVANPTAYPIQFSDVASGPNVIVATLPDSSGQTTYVAGSATITGGSATATSVTGSGPWTLQFAPGVIAAGATATLTYDVETRPTAIGLPKSLFFAGASGTGTAGSYVDETCANGAGGASVCGATALTNATLSVGPLCQLAGLVTTAPSLAIAKQLTGAAVDNGNGTFTVPFRLVVENLGTTTIAPLQVTDDLTSAFPAPAVVVSVTPVSTSILSGVGTLTANGAYNGVGDTNLLASGTSSLDSGGTGQLDFSVTFRPTGLPGPFLNQATVSGTTSLGGTFVDSSDDGTDPDTDGDGLGNEPGTGCPSSLPATNCENDPTPVTIPTVNAIGLAKQATALVYNGDGTYTVTFRLLVENLGPRTINTLQVVDSLSAAFPLPATVVGVTPVAASILSGVGTLTANAAYNGASDTDLLTAGSSSLNSGATGQIDFSVTFNLNGSLGPFSNQATVSGIDTLGATLVDLSDDGTDGDSDGDGVGNEAGTGCPSTVPATNCENDPTLVIIPTVEAIGLAKQANAPVDNGNGTFTVPFRLTVENLGTTAINTLQVVDNLAAAFPAPATVVSVTGVSTSILAGVGTLTANGAYNGVGDTNLLTAGSSSLNSGAIGQIDLSVTFNPNGLPGPFFNQATISGTSSPSGTVIDSSDNGTDPDPDGDRNGNEAGTGCPSTVPATNCENDPTPVIIGSVNAMGLAKQANAPVQNGDGTVTVPFRLVVTNLGNGQITQLQVVDNLAAAFPAPAAVVSVTPVSTSILSGVGTLTANGAYNGVSDTSLLSAGTSSLNAGASGQIDLSVTFHPNGTPGPFFNQATGSATTSLGGTLTDLSDEGANPDTDNDGVGDETGTGCPSAVPATNCENDATRVTIATVNAIGLAKQANAPVDNGNGTFTVTFVLTVENVGILNFSSVQATDNLAATFPSPATVVSVTTPVTSIVSGVGTLSSNNTFNGTSDTNLLVADSSTLNLGAVGQIMFDVTFNPSGTSAFVNTAQASGSNTSGTVNDTSDNGGNPDPDGDGNASGPGENDATPITVTLAGPVIRNVPMASSAGLQVLLVLLAVLGLMALRRPGSSPTVRSPSH